MQSPQWSEKLDEFCEKVIKKATTTDMVKRPDTGEFVPIEPPELYVVAKVGSTTKRQGPVEGFRVDVNPQWEPAALHERITDGLEGVELDEKEKVWLLAYELGKSSVVARCQSRPAGASRDSTALSTREARDAVGNMGAALVHVVREQREEIAHERRLTADLIRDLMSAHKEIALARVEAMAGDGGGGMSDEHFAAGLDLMREMGPQLLAVIGLGIQASMKPGSPESPSEVGAQEEVEPKAKVITALGVLSKELGEHPELAGDLEVSLAFGQLLNAAGPAGRAGLIQMCEALGTPGGGDDS